MTTAFFTARRIAAALAALALALTCARWLSAEAEGLPGPAAFSPSHALLPPLDGATAWINSPPLTPAALRGKVVLVDFWTYSCINCLRTLPYVRAWAQKYRDHGLVVIGAHTPEFDFEQRVDNVQRAVRDLGIDYPVAVDSTQALWRAFGTRAWPTLYFVDAQGRIRHRQLGEGRYDDAERMIQQLLREAGRAGVPADLVAPQGLGTQAAAGAQPAASSETYLGADNATGFDDRGGPLRNGSERHDAAPAGAAPLALNHWALQGRWRVEGDHVQALQPGATLRYRFRARDLHLVLGSGSDTEGRPLRFRVTVDGRPPLADAGTDVAPDGSGRIEAHRLYQLVRQSGAPRERLFEIEFLDAAPRAYAFTFG
jgi:thiol-disulfide isomerase/thioredoxin